jgi:hypothetical protein
MLGLIVFIAVISILVGVKNGASIYRIMFDLHGRWESYLDFANHLALLSRVDGFFGQIHVQPG